MRNRPRKIDSAALLVWCLVSLAGCGAARTVTSFVPGVGTDEIGPSAGERLYLKIPPEEAVVVLRDIAPEYGWEVAGTGDQFDMNGLRGKYFRLETDKFIGGKQTMSGVFYSEPDGSYVIIGKRKTGLPIALVTPLTAAVEQRTRAVTEP